LIEREENADPIGAKDERLDKSRIYDCNLSNYRYLPYFNSCNTDRSIYDDALRSLNFCSNQIGDEGALALGEALKLNSTLTYLQLGQNNISNKGALALGSALESNPVLTSLSLASNKIGNEGALALRSMLSNPALKSLAL
jgi:hypothetical protein